MTSLYLFIFWSVAGITTIVSILLSFSIIRFQRNMAGKSADTGNFRDNPALGFIWSLVPIAILAVLLILAFRALPL
jgi:heme/copper-type cytochrome/quinol oxidase subunit 2